MRTACLLCHQLKGQSTFPETQTSSLLEMIKLDKEKYKCGQTKVFFRAGILGFMEEVHKFDLFYIFSSSHIILFSYYSLLICSSSFLNIPLHILKLIVNQYREIMRSS